jgi:hypothetical protein
MTDLNELSDGALRLALARALERNAHLEGLISSIGERVKSLDNFTMDLTEEEYVKLSLVFDSVAAYREEYSWVEDEREGETDDDCGGPAYPHECPFFSETFMYELFGKEEARTILAYFQQIQRLADEDEHEVKRREEYRGRVMRNADTVAFLVGRIQRNRKYLDPKNTNYKPHKLSADIQEELDHDCGDLERQVVELAHSVQYHFGDN